MSGLKCGWAVAVFLFCLDFVASRLPRDHASRIPASRRRSPPVSEEDLRRPGKAAALQVFGGAGFASISAQARATSLSLVFAPGIRA